MGKLIEKKPDDYEEKKRTFKFWGNSPLQKKTKNIEEDVILKTFFQKK